jgi:succinate dehydrogenase flavin-adding protein (antitoxin of CptAB toxin-antitoxin module)
MQELDLLLNRWLDLQYPQAAPALRAQFEALLELPDPQLAGYLLGASHGESAPGEPPRELLDSIRYQGAVSV